MTTETLAPYAVAVDRLTYRYGDRVALDGLTLVVPRGAIFGLLGPNGSGKSTLLSLLIARRQADGDGIRILGEAPSDHLRRRIGVLFQEPSLDPAMTVRETLALQARLFAMPRAEAGAAMQRILARVGLADRAAAYTSTLSGGMKRRLEAARALMTSPELLLLDEPTIALDPDSRRALWEYLLEANAAGTTLLVATNDVAEAERYCTRVALIDRGRLVAEGAPAELKRDLRHDAVRIDWKDDAGPHGDAIARWEGVGSVRVSGATTHVTVDAATPFVTRIFQEHGAAVHAVRIEESTLEDVYFQLVGRSLTAPSENAGEVAQDPSGGRKRRFGRRRP